MGSNIVYGKLGGGGLQLHHKCKVDAERKGMKCDGESGEVKFQLNCDPQDKCNIQPVDEKRKPTGGPFNIEGANGTTYLLLDLIEKISLEPSTGMDTSDFIAEVEYKIPYGNISSEQKRFTAGGGKNAIEKYLEWQSKHSNNISSAKYFTLRSVKSTRPLNLEIKKLADTEKFADTVRFLNQPQSFVVTKDDKPLNIFFSISKLQDFLEKQKESESGNLMLLHFKNTPEKREVPTVVTAQKWSVLQNFTRWLETSQQSMLPDTYQETSTMGGNSTKWNITLSPTLTFGHAWLKRGLYHRAIANNYIDPEFNASNMLELPPPQDPTLAGGIHRLGIEGGATVYPYQDFLGVGITGSYASSGPLSVFDAMLKVEFDPVSLAVQNPDVGALVYGALGATKVWGESKDAQLDSHDQNISGWGFQHRFGAGVYVHLADIGYTGSLRLGISADYTHAYSNLSPTVYGVTTGEMSYWRGMISFSIGERRMPLKKIVHYIVGYDNIDATEYKEREYTFGGTTWQPRAEKVETPPEPIPETKPAPKPVKTVELPPLMPEEYKLSELQRIELPPIKIEFVVGKPTIHDKDKDKPEQIVNEFIKKIEEAYPQDKYPEGPPKGSKLYLWIKGHASSEYNAIKNMSLSMSRTTRISSEIYRLLMEKKETRALKNLTFDLSDKHIFPRGMGEQEPLDQAGKMIRNFGGYENDDANHFTKEKTASKRAKKYELLKTSYERLLKRTKNAKKKAKYEKLIALYDRLSKRYTELHKLIVEKGGTYILCQGDPDKKISHEKCANATFEPEQDSRRVELRGLITPPNAPAIPKPSYLDVDTQARIEDEKIGQKLSQGLKRSKWYKRGENGMKDIFFANGNMNIVLDEYGFTKNMKKLSNGLISNAKALQDKYGYLSAGTNIKFWLFYPKQEPKDYDEQIRRAFWKFESWPFRGGIDVGLKLLDVKHSQNFDYRKQTNALKEQLKSAQEKLATKVTQYKFQTDGAEVVAIPVQTEDNKLAIDAFVRDATGRDKKITVLYNFKKRPAEEAIRSRAKLIQWSHPDLSRYYVTEDMEQSQVKAGEKERKLGDYVILIAAKAPIDLKSAAAKILLSNILKELENKKK